MPAGESLRSKCLYKTLLVLLKFMPMVIAGCYILNTFCNCLGIDSPLFSYIGGLSFIPWFYIYISTWVFRFCIYHRMFLYYILLNDTVNTLDMYYQFSVSDLQWIGIHSILLGIFLFLILYFYVKHHKKLAKENTQ